MREDLGPAALADLMAGFALGMVAMFELELPLDVDGLRKTLRGVIAPPPTPAHRGKAAGRGL